MDKNTSGKSSTQGKVSPLFHDQSRETIQTQKSPQIIPGSIFDQCRRLLLTHLDKGLDQTLDLMDDTLFAQAEKAGNNVEQTLYFDTMREIRRNRSTITRGLHSHISAAFVQFLQTPASTAEREIDTDEDRMTLVNTEAYEDDVQITNLTTRAEAENHEQLFSLQQRFLSLYPDLTVDNDHNPLAPRAISQSFARAIEPASLHARIKPDIYRLFEETTIEPLGTVYKAVNALLIENNILPELRYVPRAKMPESETTKSTEKPNPVRENTLKATAPQVTTVNQSGPAQASQPAAFVMPEPVDLASLKQIKIRQFRQQQSTHETRQTSAWSREDLLSALTRLQKKALKNDYTPFTNHEGTSAFRCDLMDELKGGNKEEQESPNHFSEGDEGSISLTGQLFEHIQKDPELPEDYRPLLSQMALPWVQLTLTDDSLLEDRQHPARILLNTMIRAAGHYRGCQNISANLLSECRKLINQLNQEEALSREQVKEQLDALENYIVWLQKRAGTIEQRAVASVKGQETLMSARLWAVQSLNERTEGHTLSPFVDLFLSAIWVDTLTITAIRAQNENEKTQVLELTDKLINILITPQDLVSPPWNSVRQQIKNTLQKAGSQTDTVVEQLLKGLSKEINGQQGDKDWLSRIAQDHHPQGELPENVSTRHAQPMEQLQVGRQYLRTLSENQTVPWKLTWRSQNHGHYLFVDSAGQKAALTDNETLLQWLTEGTLRESPSNRDDLVTRTLHSIEQQLNQSQPPKASTD